MTPRRQPVTPSRGLAAIGRSAAPLVIPAIAALFGDARSGDLLRR
jgi:hypothetical protein